MVDDLRMCDWKALPTLQGRIPSKPADHPGIKLAGINNLTRLTALVAHMRQLVIARAETNGGNPQADCRHRVRAEIPVSILFGRVSKCIRIGRDEGS